MYPGVRSERPTLETAALRLPAVDEQDRPNIVRAGKMRRFLIHAGLEDAIKQENS